MSYQLQLSLPDEQFQTLSELAAERGQTLEELVSGWLAEWQELQDERRFWGDDVIEQLRQQRDSSNRERGAIDRNDEEFFRAIRQTPQP